MHGSEPAPWQLLPAPLADRIEPELPELAEEIIAALRAAIPEYDQPLRGSFGRGVRRGVENALADFLELMRGREPRRPGRSVYVELGAGEWRQGRSLDALQAAYRLGARVAWRRVSSAAQAGGAGADTMRLLAEAVFAYIDGLAGESVAGYAEEQARAAGERELRRGELTELLLRGTTPADALASAAARARWPLPRRLAALAAGDPERARQVAAALGPDVLLQRDPPLLLVPDPHGPGRRARLRGILDDPGLSLGPDVEPAAARRSADRALAALPLARETSVIADDRLADIALLEAAAPLADLAGARLAALDALPPGKRQRLSHTLAAWLRHRGSAPRIAAELHLHPQTVRYRVAALRDILGAEALEDPDTRFELDLALRARRTAAATH